MMKIKACKTITVACIWPAITGKTHPPRGLESTLHFCDPEFLLALDGRLLCGNK